MNENLRQVLSKRINIPCLACNSSGTIHRRSGGSTIIASCHKCKGTGNLGKITIGDHLRNKLGLS